MTRGTGGLSAGPTSFTGVSLSIYWSSSSSETSPKAARGVSLNIGIIGSVGSKDTNNVVWALRGGQ
jgi:hypothetical protein